MAGEPMRLGPQVSTLSLIGLSGWEQDSLFMP